MTAAGGGGAYGGGGGGGEGGGTNGGGDGGGCWGGEGEAEGSDCWMPEHCWVIGAGQLPGFAMVHTSNANIGTRIWPALCYYLQLLDIYTLEEAVKRRASG